MQVITYIRWYVNWGMIAQWSRRVRSPPVPYYLITLHRSLADSSFFFLPRQTTSFYSQSGMRQLACTLSGMRRTACTPSGTRQIACTSSGHCVKPRDFGPAESHENRGILLMFLLDIAVMFLTMSIFARLTFLIHSTLLFPMWDLCDLSNELPGDVSQ
jgi:hypothetical protein